LQRGGGISGLLARTENPASVAGLQQASLFYGLDGAGNITCLLNQGSAVVARYQYDPFGRFSAMGSGATMNAYCFSSKEQHTPSGLIYYGFRFYDPGLSRWLSKDPLQERGGVNLYSFVRNSPVLLLDILGLDAADWCKYNFGKTPGEMLDDWIDRLKTTPPRDLPSAAYRGTDPLGAFLGNAGESLGLSFYQANAGAFSSFGDRHPVTAFGAAVAFVGAYVGVGVAQGSSVTSPPIPFLGGTIKFGYNPSPKPRSNDPADQRIFAAWQCSL
jgi:RHS repeat-associated protein